MTAAMIQFRLKCDEETARRVSTMLTEAEAEGKRKAMAEIDDVAEVLLALIQFPVVSGQGAHIRNEAERLGVRDPFVGAKNVLDQLYGCDELPNV